MPPLFAPAWLCLPLILTATANQLARPSELLVPLPLLPGLTPPVAQGSSNDAVSPSPCPPNRVRPSADMGPRRSYTFRFMSYVTWQATSDNTMLTKSRKNSTLFPLIILIIYVSDGFCHLAPTLYSTFTTLWV